MWDIVLYCLVWPLRSHKSCLKRQMPLFQNPETQKLQNALRRSTNDAKTVYDSMPPDRVGCRLLRRDNGQALSSIAVLRGRKSCAKVVLSVCYAFE